MQYHYFKPSKEKQNYENIQLTIENINNYFCFSQNCIQNNVVFTNFKDALENDAKLNPDQSTKAARLFNNAVKAVITQEFTPKEKIEAIKLFEVHTKQSRFSVKTKRAAIVAAGMLTLWVGVQRFPAKPGNH